MTKTEAAAADGMFQPNHRAGYGTVEARTQRVIDWLDEHPHATLSSGEGMLLLQRIRALEALLHDVAPVPAVLPPTNDGLQYAF